MAGNANHSSHLHKKLKKSLNMQEIIEQDHAKDIMLYSIANPAAKLTSCLPAARPSPAPLVKVDAEAVAVVLPLDNGAVVTVGIVELAGEEDPVADAVVEAELGTKVVFETIGPPGTAVVMAEVVAFEADTIGPPGNAVVIAEVTTAAVVEAAATELILVGVTTAVVELMVLPTLNAVLVADGTLLNPEAPTQAFI